MPSIYAARRINDKISLGFASFTQHGLSTDSTPNASITDKSELTSLNLDPSLSCRVNPCARVDPGYPHLFASGTWSNEPAIGNGVFTGNASGDVGLVAIGVSGTF